MRFAKWFSENEVPVVAFPDPKKFYLACVLDPLSQKHLISFAEKVYLEQMSGAIPKGWVFVAHHMTVKFNVNLQDFQKNQNLFGQDVKIKVVRIGWDDNCIAAVVTTNPPVHSDNPIAHITIAHSNSVSAVYSNNMLADKKNWKAGTEDHTELGSKFLAVFKFNQSKVWPEVSHPLAAPSLVT